jgi:hypothetical protein
MSHFFVKLLSCSLVVCVVTWSYEIEARLVVQEASTVQLHQHECHGHDCLHSLDRPVFRSVTTKDRSEHQGIHLELLNAHWPPLS